MPDTARKHRVAELQPKEFSRRGTENAEKNLPQKGTKATKKKK